MDGRFDDILIHTDTPVILSFTGNAHIGDCLRRRSMGQCMFFIGRKFVADTEELLDCVAHGVQTTVSVCIDDGLLSAKVNFCLCHNTIILLEMARIDCKVRHFVHIVFFKDLVYPLWRKFFVFFIRYLFHCISDFFFHCLRQRNGEILL